MIDLKSLWKNRVRVIHANVQYGQKNHRELANIASQIGADYHGRFIIELLQNASDQATAASRSQSMVTIIRTSNVIAFANEAGRPGKLHSKCAVVDSTALVGSGNLTDDAFNRNMELGLLVNDASTADALHNYFTALITRNEFVRQET